MDKSKLSVKGLEFHRMIKIQILSAKSKKLMFQIHKDKQIKIIKI
jgi:hypothetical protein